MPENTKKLEYYAREEDMMKVPENSIGIRYYERKKRKRSLL